MILFHFKTDTQLGVSGILGRRETAGGHRRQQSAAGQKKIGAAEPCAISYYSSALWRPSARFASAAAVSLRLS